jgi:hypothetical protein
MSRFIQQNECSPYGTWAASRRATCGSEGTIRVLSVLTTCTSTEVGLWARIDWHFLKVFLFHVLHFQ